MRMPMNNYSQQIEIARYPIDILNKIIKKYRPMSILYSKTTLFEFSLMFFR